MNIIILVLLVLLTIYIIIISTAVIRALFIINYVVDNIYQVEITKDVENEYIVKQSKQTH